MELRWHIWFVWLAFALIAVSATRTDPDLWGHVRFGLDSLRTHALPAVDPYSFTQDRSWINHEWLSEAFMGAAYQLAGTAGLVVMKMAVIGCALAVLAWRLRGSTPIVATSICALAIIAILPLSGTVRPQIWSVLGLVLVMLLFDSEREPGAARAMGAAVLFAVWANLHGGWITGAIVLGAYAAIRVVRAPRQAVGWTILLVAAATATAVNPYGVTLWRFLATTVRASRPDITEWQPFTVHEPPIMWVSILVPLVIASALTYKKETRPRFEIWVVLLLLVGAGLRVSRVAPLMAPAALALLAPHIRCAWGNVARLTVSSAPASVILSTPAIIALLAAWTPTSRALSCIPISDSWAPDRAAAAQLAGLSGRLWTTFDWGEYAIWHFGPELRVSIDGRRETVYSDDVVRWHRAFEAGDAAAQARFAGIRPEYVWLRADRVVAREWLATHGYRVDVRTDSSFIGVRSDLPRLRSVNEQLPGCFP